MPMPRSTDGPNDPDVTDAGRASPGEGPRTRGGEPRARPSRSPTSFRVTPSRANALDRRAADEVALGRLDDPAEARLERTGGLVDVVAVERELHLEPERVARAEADRLDAVAAARLDQRVPERGGAVRGA